MTTPQMTRLTPQRFRVTVSPRRGRVSSRFLGKPSLLGRAGVFGSMCSIASVLLVAILAIALSPFAAPVRADDGGMGADLFPAMSLGRYGQGDLGGLDQQDPAVLKASLYSITDHPQLAVVELHVDLESPWHIYSLTQPKGGPLPTKLKLLSDDTLELIGDWKSDSPPKRSISEAFGGITIEEHVDEVTFFGLAKIQPADQTAESLPEIRIEVSALTCLTDGSCQPLDETLVAEYAGQASSQLARAAMGASEPASPVTPLFQDEDYAVQWRAYATTSTLRPGQQGTLVFKAIPEGEFHVYPAVVGDDPMSTNFAIEDKAGLKIAAPTTEAEIISEDLVPGVTNRYHEGDVTWTMPIEVPADAEPGERTIRGAIGYQACTSSSCLVPKALRFEAVINVLPGDAPESGVGVQAAATALTVAKFGEVKKLAGNTDWVDAIEPAVTASESPALPRPSGSVPGSSGSVPGSSGAASGPLAGRISDDAAAEASPAPVVVESSGGTVMGLPLILGLALLGGFILNFMPCVLPVVGLKVMSFVQQAGSDRRRAFLLNFSYASGIMTIFILLAVLMVIFSMAWGEMFTHPEVRIAMIVLMFALALSYFGVWELPAPGMASSQGAQELQKREGYTGAFFKGMFATVLSTPCSGPFLGGIFALIGGKLPPVQSTIVILVVGIGMAVPYVLMGIWPKMMAWLPKPGPWMETFKEFLAFLFLATVAFFFYTFNDADKMWVFTALMGVWFGCWIIGKTPSWQTAQRRLIAWFSGVGVAVAISVLAFNYLGPMTPEQQAQAELIAWEPYNETRLQELQAEGKTVMIDFTAKWCVNCIVNFGVAIDTQPTADMVEELGAVAMYADWTDRSPEIKAKLDELQSKSIPLLAIYPGNAPARPILLRDLVSQQAVLDALRQAGPSQPGPMVPHKLTETPTRVTR